MIVKRSLRRWWPSPSSAGGPAAAKSPGREPVQVVEREDVLERREVVRDGLDLRELVRRPRRRWRRASECASEVADVLASSRRTPASPTAPIRASAKSTSADSRLFRARSATLSPLRTPRARKPVRIRAHALVRLRPRHLAPAVVDLDEVRRARARPAAASRHRLRDRTARGPAAVSREAGVRAVPSRHGQLRRGEGFRGSSGEIRNRRIRRPGA